MSVFFFVLQLYLNFFIHSSLFSFISHKYLKKQILIQIKTHFFFCKQKYYSFKEKILQFTRFLSHNIILFLLIKFLIRKVVLKFTVNFDILLVDSVLRTSPFPSSLYVALPSVVIRLNPDLTNARQALYPWHTPLTKFSIYLRDLMVTHTWQEACHQAESSRCHPQWVRVSLITFADKRRAVCFINENLFYYVCVLSFTFIHYFH